MSGAVVEATIEMAEFSEGQFEAKASGNLISIVIAGIVGTLVMAASPLIVDGLIHAWGLTPSQAGYIASIEIAGSCLGTLLVVLLGSRISSRRLIGGGMALIVIGNLLCAQRSGFPALVAFRFIAGIGGGLTMAFVALLAQSARPQLNYAIYMASLNIIVSAFSVSVPSLLLWHGVGGVYIVIASVTALSLTVIGGLPDHLSTPAPSTANNHPSGRRFFKLDRGASASLLLQMFAFGAVAMVWVYLGEFASRHGLADNALSVAVSISWIAAGTTGALAAGFLEGRLAPKLAVLGACLGLIGIIALLWYGESYTLVVTGIVLFVFAWSFLSPPVMSILATIDPSGKLATGGMLVQTIGFSAGPALAAAILQYTGIGWVAITSIIALVIGIISLKFIRSASSTLAKRSEDSIVSRGVLANS